MFKSILKNIFFSVAVIFYLTACGSADSTSESEGTTQKSPSISITSNLDSISANESVVISWSAANVSSCVASGDWSGEKGITGSVSIDSLTNDSTFVLSCTGPDGSVTGSVFVQVTNPDFPTVSLSASPSSITLGGSTTLNWISNNADSCIATGDWSGAKATSGSEVISSINTSSVFGVSCTGTAGEISTSVNVNVMSPSVPTVSLSSSESNVVYDGSTTLTWSSTDADSCTASGDWSGARSTLGTEVVSNLTADSNYSLSCNGAGGSAIDAVSVVVAAPGAPSVNLAASSTSIAYDGETTLSWNSAGADSCTATGDWSGPKNTSGSELINGLTVDSNFTLSCSGIGGSSSQAVNITVASAPVPVLTFSASALSVPENDSTTLTWSATDADSCIASGDWGGNKGVSGTETISSIASDSQFILNCSGTGGSDSQVINVTVVMSSNGTALLSWTPPTENTDNSALTDLAGYKIYYGNTSGNYTDSIDLNNAGLTSYLVESLAAADWYFVMTSYNSTGIESAYSSEVSKTIN